MIDLTTEDTITHLRNEVLPIVEFDQMIIRIVLLHQGNLDLVIPGPVPVIELRFRLRKEHLRGYKKMNPQVIQIQGELMAIQ
jgi:hypothetical protein